MGEIPLGEKIILGKASQDAFDKLDASLRKNEEKFQTADPIEANKVEIRVRNGSKHKDEYVLSDRVLKLKQLTRLQCKTAYLRGLEAVVGTSLLEKLWEATDKLKQGEKNVDVDLSEEEKLELQIMRAHEGSWLVFFAAKDNFRKMSTKKILDYIENLKELNDLSEYVRYINALNGKGVDLVESFRPEHDE